MKPNEEKNDLKTGPNEQCYVVVVVPCTCGICNA